MKTPVPLGPAIVIALSLTTLFVLGLAVVVPSPQQPLVSANSSDVAVAAPAAAATETAAVDPELAFLTSQGEQAKVTRVVDGDTFMVGRRTIKVIGIESCPASTSGGRQAVEFAQNWLMDGQSVTLRRAPGFNKDSAGRELRVVEEQEHGFDFGTSIVAFKHTRAEKGAPGPAAYLETLQGADDGRDCSRPREEPIPTTTRSPEPTSDNDIDVHVGGGHDGGMRDGALTGGYCRKKWWC